MLNKRQGFVEKNINNLNLEGGDDFTLPVLVDCDHEEIERDNTFRIDHINFKVPHIIDIDKQNEYIDGLRMNIGITNDPSKKGVFKHKFNNKNICVFSLRNDYAKRLLYKLIYYYNDFKHADQDIFDRGYSMLHELIIKLVKAKEEALKATCDAEKKRQRDEIQALQIQIRELSTKIARYQDQIRNLQAPDSADEADNLPPLPSDVVPVDDMQISQLKKQIEGLERQNTTLITESDTSKKGLRKQIDVLKQENRTLKDQLRKKKQALPPPESSPPLLSSEALPPPPSVLPLPPPPPPAAVPSAADDETPPETISGGLFANLQSKRTQLRKTEPNSPNSEPSAGKDGTHPSERDKRQLSGTNMAWLANDQAWQVAELAKAQEKKRREAKAKAERAIQEGLEKQRRATHDSGDENDDDAWNDPPQSDSDSDSE